MSTKNTHLWKTCRCDTCKDRRAKVKNRRIDRRATGNRIIRIGDTYYPNGPRGL